MTRYKLAIAVAMVFAIGYGPLASQLSDFTASQNPLRTNEWAIYYEDYFYSEDTCNARGNAVTGNQTGTGEIPGALAFSCILHAGDSKWSMYLLWA